MHYSIYCYVAITKALPVKYQITAHRPFMNGLVVKMRSVTLTVYKSAQLRKIVMVAEKRFS